MQSTVLVPQRCKSKQPAHTHTTKTLPESHRWILLSLVPRPLHSCKGGLGTKQGTSLSLSKCKHFGGANLKNVKFSPFQGQNSCNIGTCFQQPNDCKETAITTQQREQTAHLLSCNDKLVVLGVVCHSTAAQFTSNAVQLSLHRETNWS